MNTLILIAVFGLIILAIFDLVVGVSNDAVNFLTSAVGSKVARYKRIILVASLGVVIGALASGGMMEVAKSGVFHPDKYSYLQVLFVFIVVMLTDVLLLDTFNTLKLPTSTTVSIVFELLGASTAMAIVQMNRNGEALINVEDYINLAKAGKMITAIFASVIIAFVAGWFIQVIVRSLVGFDFTKRQKYAGPIFGAISMTIVVNFLFNSGLKHSPYKNTEWVQWILTNYWLVGSVIFVVSLVLFFLLSLRRKFNPFIFVTMFGTFALAMAFASNDLVNFIGVPIASLEGFFLWHDSGVGADEYMMTEFTKEGSTLWGINLLLLIAGGIMVTTLLLSKKAKNVISTSVNLSNQSNSVERFQGNPFVRVLVRGVSFVANKFYATCVPKVLREALGRRFDERFYVKMEVGGERVAFDFVRASVNLMVATLVITFGTTYKLPLSTTYVSFMVLMGTSLADKAWNRDTAVYRVSGVFAVIGGWFITAFIAFLVAFLFALVIINLGFIGVGIVLLLVVLGLYIVSRIGKQVAKEEVGDVARIRELEEEEFNVQTFLEKEVSLIAKEHQDLFKSTVECLNHQDRKRLDSYKVSVQKKIRENDFAQNYLESADNDKLDSDTVQILIQFLELELMLLEVDLKMVRSCFKHIDNFHTPMRPSQIEKLEQVEYEVSRFCDYITTGKDKKIQKRYLKAMKVAGENSFKSSLGDEDRKVAFEKNTKLFFKLIFKSIDAVLVLYRLSNFRTQFDYSGYEEDESED